MTPLMRAPNRVVITGLGCVTPIGLDVASFGAALFAGVSGAGPITLFDPARLRTRVAAEVKLAMADLPCRDRKLAFAERAAAEAMADAGLPAGGADAALSLGIGLELFSLDDMRARREPGFVLPTAPAARMTTLQTPSDLCAAHLSARYDLRGAPALHLSACAAGTDALGAAFRRIRRGDARLILAGGADSMINPLGVGGFSKIQAMTVQNERPAAASRPFDEARDGFLLGEGAGMLVLESLESARARGARIHAEIRGYGRSLDAHGISEPHPEGRGALAAMRNALADAGLRPEDVDAVNAHGTATPKNDRIEAAAVRALLGDRWPSVPVNATKSLIGHLIAAAGPVESIGVILGLQRGALHPTLNLDALDPACALDHVTGSARAAAHRTVLKSSFGFGGHNASLVFTRFEEMSP
jgi:3-oxoacyl-[acyl-carrier-protein] synthase II